MISTKLFTAALERLTRQIEASGALDRWGQAISEPVSTVIRPGWLKDLLSGTWMGHPAHPMLTDVTIGAWTSALMLDVLGDESTRPGADRLIALGILTAVPTAAAGVSDLIDVTAREDRSVGVAHAIANLSALTLYTAAYGLRRAGARRTGLGLSMAAAGVATAGGFLGGHLSFRRGVGVDRTAFERRPTRWTAVLDEAELGQDTPRRATVDGTELVLLRRGDRIFALANRCSHRGGPLVKGRVVDEEIECPWHLSRFRLDDGSVVQGPATAPQPAYETRVVDGKVQVRAPSSSRSRARARA